MKEYANCEQAREEFSALLDGELDIEEQDGIERHLSECLNCLRELDGLKKVTDEYDDLSQVVVPGDLEEAIHEEIERPLKNLMNVPLSTRPVSFKPVAVAVVVLAMMATLSYLITQAATPVNESSPTPIEEFE